MENYFRVKGAEVMQNCLEQAQQGKYEEARATLAQTVKDIEASTKVNKEKIASLVKDLNRS